MKLKTKTLVLTNSEVYKYDGLAQAIVNFHGRLDLSNRLWFVIFKGKQWIVYSGYREIDDEKVYFGPTFVKEEFRGMGLQRKLIRAKLRKAKEDEYKEAYSSTYASNYQSANNLITEGFRITQIPKYYDVEIDEVWFKKQL